MLTCKTWNTASEIASFQALVLADWITNSFFSLSSLLVIIVVIIFLFIIVIIIIFSWLLVSPFVRFVMVSFVMTLDVCPFSRLVVLR